MGSCCVACGALSGAWGWPGMGAVGLGGEEDSGGRGYMCDSGWFVLLYGRGQRSIVKI